MEVFCKVFCIFYADPSGSSNKGVCALFSFDSECLELMNGTFIKDGVESGVDPLDWRLRDLDHGKNNIVYLTLSNMVEKILNLVCFEVSSQKVILDE